jgi:GTP-binding protein Era
MNSQSAREGAARHGAGYVAIVGRPNAGKSTLLNHMVGAKLSIVSRKAQTTRMRITGIVTREHAQIVLVDTPGYQTEHRSTLNKMMNRSVTAAAQSVDAVIWVVEALAFDDRDRAVEKLVPREVPVVLAVNKIDRIRDKKLLLPFLQQLAATRDFADLVPISAARGTQVEDLIESVARLLPQGPPLFDADEITTVSERVLAAELLREKLFRLLGDELPYSAAVEIEQFTLDAGLRRIHAAVIVGKEGHKAMVIGKGGAQLKAIATQARHDMERLFGGKVYLEVWVKVRKGWADDEGMLNRLGYDA